MRVRVTKLLVALMALGATAQAQQCSEVVFPAALACMIPRAGRWAPLTVGPVMLVRVQGRDAQLLEYSIKPLVGKMSPIRHATVESNKGAVEKLTREAAPMADMTPGSRHPRSARRAPAGQQSQGEQTMRECSDRQRAIDAFERERAGAWKGASLQIPDGVEVRLNVPYGTGGDKQLTTDLFLPPERFKAPRAAMLYIHGGGWRGGSPTQFYRHAAQLAAHGVLGSCCRYRFSGEATFPAPVEDVKAAVRWLRASADELHIDTDRIGTLGGSSGGHLAAMLATTAAVEQLEGTGGHGNQPSDVQLAVLLNPITDMTAFGPEAPLRAAVLQLMGGPMRDIPSAYQLASPLLQIGNNTPPSLLMHGRADRAVPCEQSERFTSRMRQLNLQAEMVAVEGVEHGFFNHDPHFERVYRKIEDFVLAGFALTQQ